MIENLIKVLTPPSNPKYCGSKDKWKEIEDKLGVPLPDDYKKFINIYGNGNIGDFLFIFSPFIDNDDNLLTAIEIHQEGYAISKKEFPEYYPRPPFPEKNSLIIFGGTDNGDRLFWVYDNEDPNKWKVGIFSERDGEERAIHDMNMSTFLEKLVKNELVTDGFPEDFLENENMKFERVYRDQNRLIVGERSYPYPTED